MAEVSQTYTNKDLNLSPSVSSARDRFPPDEPISAVAFVNAILDYSDHRTKYADGKASDLILDEDPTTDFRRTAETWLQDIRSLYDASAAPKLHGRLVIIGLSLLEPSLRQRLRHDGFQAALEKDLKQPLIEFLTPKGRDLYRPPDSVPNQPDDPLHSIDEDQLGRAAFARYLAKRIFAVDTNGAYAIHLYGPWGAGKSTLLNFLRAELEPETAEKNAVGRNWWRFVRALGLQGAARKNRETARTDQDRRTEGQEREDQAKDQQGQKDAEEKRWLVVEYNAWRHQHIRPPWWSLMESVYRQTKGELGPWNRFREGWWRFNTGRTHLLIGITVLAWILVFGVYWLTPDADSLSGTLEFWATTAERAGSVLALLISIWAIIQAASHSFLPGSARAVQEYVESTHNPMNKIRERFNELIHRLKPHRIAILIDDLDRCQGDYVVELLEGIQTLFRDAPVVFVIAADRRWLNACFEEVYADLKTLVHAPGKPLGTLFLEKAFQFSTSVPGIPEPLRDEYWQRLIQVKAEHEEGSQEAEIQKARDLLANTDGEGNIMQVVSDSHDRSFPVQRAIREEAVIRLASPAEMERTEHTLKRFADLLEPNPRAMKRLVNAYSVNRALATLAFVDIGRDQLALWTILTLRWPQLADYLQGHPQKVEKIRQKDLSDVDETVRDLFGNPEVIEVVDSSKVADGLDPDTVRQCASLRA